MEILLTQENNDTKTIVFKESLILDASEFSHIEINSFVKELDFKVLNETDIIIYNKETKFIKIKNALLLLQENDDVSNAEGSYAFSLSFLDYEVSSYIHYLDLLESSKATAYDFNTSFLDYIFLEENAIDENILNPRIQVEEEIIALKIETEKEDSKNGIFDEEKLSPVLKPEPEPEPDSEKERDGFYARAIADYVASGETELNMVEDGYFFILPRYSENGWWYGIDEQGVDGWIPSNYLRECSEEEQLRLEQMQREQTDHGEFLVAMNRSYRNLKDNGHRISMTPKVPPVFMVNMNMDKGDTRGHADDSSSSSDTDIVSSNTTRQ